MNTKELASRQEILDKAKELADLIAKSNEVETFKIAEQKVKKNEKIQSLIAQIKRKQKEAVHAEHYKKPNLLALVEEELKQLNEELFSIPLVQEFQQTQADINDLLQLVTNVISNTVTEKIILSTGGNPLYGQTGNMQLDEE